MKIHLKKYNKLKVLSTINKLIIYGQTKVLKHVDHVVS